MKSRVHNYNFKYRDFDNPNRGSEVMCQCHLACLYPNGVVNTWTWSRTLTNRGRMQHILSEHSIVKILKLIIYLQSFQGVRTTLHILYFYLYYTSTGT